MPPVDDAMAARFDPVSGHSVVVTGRLGYEGASVIHRAAIVVAPVRPLGAPVHRVVLAPAPSDVIVVSVEALPTESGAMVRFGPGGAGAPADGWLDVGPAGLSPASSERGQRPRLVVWPEGGLLVAPPPPGWAVRGNHLVAPGGRASIPLGAGHASASYHSVLVTPDAQHAVVVSVRADCSEIVRHFVDLVDVGTRVVKCLSAGHKSAAALLAPDGALLLQLGTVLRRYRSATDETFETAPEGILLAAPAFTVDCSA